MANLKNLLEGISYKDDSRILDIDIKNISYNSKKVINGSLYVAIKGQNYDGYDFIKEAISNGAKAIVSEKDLAIKDTIAKILVSDTKKSLARITKNFYNTDLDKIKLVGITGTNGKTTISLLIESILKEAGYKTAVIGTLGVKFNQGVFNSLNNTTPSSLELYKLINLMVREDINYAIIEVSSHALDQKRVYGLHFKAAIFSNLSEEHLDYHKNINNYLEAKAKLFAGLNHQDIAVINRDDSAFDYLRKKTNASIFSYSINKEADFKAEEIKLSLSGSEFAIKTPSYRIYISSKLLGLHNIYNILAACAFCYSRQINPEYIKKGIEKIKIISGRLQKVNEDQPFNVFIDYAHTHNALENVLKALRTISPKDSRIITVFGCGGDRDRQKRPKMARVAADYSDFVIVTTDNPRSENPQDICDEIITGFNQDQSEKYTVILDRDKAIYEALKMASKRDNVLIAGKGHEDRQIFKDRTVKFNDKEVAEKILKELRTRK